MTCEYQHIDTESEQSADISTLHEPTVRAIIATMKRTGAAFAARVLEAQYRNDQISDDEHPEARRLRQLADFIDEHPEHAGDIKVAGRYEWCPMNMSVSTNRWEGNELVPDDPLPKMRALRRAIGGKFEKVVTDNYFQLQGKLGDTFVHIYTEREGVCEAVVVGTETKMVKDYANCPEVEQEVDIIEWICPESIA